MNGYLAVGLTALALAPAAFGDFIESEPNNDVASADFVSSAEYPTGAAILLGTLDTSDVDYYSFDLTAGDFVALSIFDYTPEDDMDNDSLLGIFAPDGTLFDSDDDGGPGFMSAYSFVVPETGTWSIAVSGFGDDLFDGTHGENFDYFVAFGINPVPAPAALALLGLAGVTTRRRRK